MMSIKDSFQNISNSSISIASVPKWIKVVILSIIPILGISIFLNKNYSELIHLKLNTLTEKLNFLILKGSEYNLYIIVFVLFFILYKRQKKFERKSLERLEFIERKNHSVEYYVQKYLESYIQLTPLKTEYKWSYSNSATISSSLKILNYQGYKFFMKNDIENLIAYILKNKIEVIEEKRKKSFFQYHELIVIVYYYKSRLREKEYKREGLEIHRDHIRVSRFLFIEDKIEKEFLYMISSIIPNLFLKDIQNKVLPAVKKLLTINEFKYIMIIFLESLLKDENDNNIKKDIERILDEYRY